MNSAASRKSFSQCEFSDLYYRYLNAQFWVTEGEF